MKQISLFAALAVLAAGTSAQASLLTVEQMAPGKFGIVNINFNGSGYNVYAGAMSANLDGGSSFDAYCVDLAHFDYLPASYQVAVDSTPSTLPNGARIGQIYNTYASQVNSADSGVALQLAIWDVLVDGGDGLDNGSFKASGYSGDALTSYIAILSTPLGNASTASSYFVALSHPDGKNQDLIGPYQGTGPVPEPTTMAVLGLGALGLLRRRKNVA
jgi:hypothetical protein